MNLSSNVRISLEDGTVTRDGQSIHLTPNEQAVLGVLVNAKGRLVDRERLNALALGYHSASRSRALDATIRRLRTKLEEDPSEPVLLLSVYGKGYRLSMARARPTPVALDVRPPWRSTLFVGREREASAVQRGLSQSRAVALCGVSGAGKSRLAAELMQSSASRYPGGRLWVDVSSAPSASEALVAIAAAMGLVVRSSTTDGVAEEIGAAIGATEGLLLVVDGAERHIDALASRVLKWREGSQAHLMLTSRLNSGLSGWRVLTLDGLPDVVATALLRDRADLAVAYSDQDATQLVRHLDGLPLAVEFAASRLRIIGMKALLRSLERGKRSGVESPGLVDAIDWALGTLSPAARTAVRRATVFQTPFGWPAFEAICLDGVAPADASGVLEELLDRCLIRREASDEGVAFTTYGAVRRALEDPSNATRDRHARWFASRSAEAPEVWGIDSAYMNRCRTGLSDWLAACRWSHERGLGEVCAALTLGISPYLHHAGPLLLHLDLLERALDVSHDSVTRGRLELGVAGAHMANMSPSVARLALVRAARALGRGNSRWHGRLDHLIGKVEWRRKSGVERWFHSAIERLEGAGAHGAAAFIQADLAQRLLSLESSGPAVKAVSPGALALSEAEARVRQADNPLAEIMVAWGRTYRSRLEGRVDAARATLVSVRDRFLDLGSAANAYSVELSLAYLAWWSIGDYSAMSVHLRAMRRLAAGFMPRRLLWDHAAVAYEDLLDERARPMLVAALEQGVREPAAREGAADAVLKLRIRLALLDANPGAPQSTVAVLKDLACDPVAQSDWTVLSEIEMAIALLWARAGQWDEAEHALKARTPGDASESDLQVRDRLAEVLLSAIQVGKGTAIDPKEVWMRAAEAGPGRLTNIAGAFLASQGLPALPSAPDHAARGTVLPHEALFARQTAALLGVG